MVANSYKLFASSLITEKSGLQIQLVAHKLKVIPLLMFPIIVGETLQLLPNWSFYNDSTALAAMD